jgi:hypothetical protein
VSPYAFVSSGTLDLENAALQNMASTGLRLSGTGGVTMSSVTFDNIGSGAGGAYLTANALASNATFYNMAFKDTPNRQPFNVKVQGSDAGLRWFFASPAAGANPRWGDTKDSDPNQKVLWADTQGPQAPALSAVSGSNTGEVSLSWQATLDREDVDPTTGTSLMKGGHYRIYRSTDSAARNASVPAQAQVVLPATTTAAGTAWSYTDTNLPLQTEYYRLWAVDELGNPTAADASATPARVAPGTAFNFQALLTAATEITLSWTHPVNPPPAYRGDYLLEFSTVSPSGPWTAVPGTVLASSTSYKHQALANNKTYYYQLTTRDNGTPPFSSAPAGPASAATADTATPQVTLEAGAGLGAKAAGLPWGTAPLLTFSKAMDPVAAGNAVSLTAKVDRLGNPMSSTVAVSMGWDPGNTLLTLTPGSPLSGNTVYELTVATSATDAGGKPMASSSTLRFVTMMDHAVRNVVTEGTGGAAVDVPAMALASDGYISGTAVPAGQAAAATQKLVSNTGDALRTPVAAGSAALEVLDAFGAPQSFSAPVTVTLPYADAAPADGVVDGTQVRADTLAVYWLDEAHGLWVRLPSSVDAVTRTVSARAAHFTAFAVIGQASSPLSTARAFPVPWRPGAGDITFTDVGQSGTIEIFTPDGAPVKSLPIGTSGQEPWDGRNDAGRPVATGVYFYRVSGGGVQQRGKLVVIR